MTITANELVQKIGTIIYDKKGFNILALEVGHFSTVTDYLIIAEGNVDRHVIAIGQEIISTLRDVYGIRPHHVEGLHAGDWLLIDYCDVIIHLFMPTIREKYQLERLWSQGQPVNLQFSSATV